MSVRSQQHTCGMTSTQSPLRQPTALEGSQKWGSAHAIPFVDPALLQYEVAEWCAITPAKSRSACLACKKVQDWVLLQGLERKYRYYAQGNDTPTAKLLHERDRHRVEATV